MTPNTPSTEGKIVGFYGFKGGAGRSLLLANLAGVLAAQDKKVLVIDCDLEAPGLGDYFDTGIQAFPSWQEKLGIMDLLVDRKTKFDLKDGEPASSDKIVAQMFEQNGLLVPGSASSCLIEVSGRPGTSGGIYLLGPGSHKAASPFPQKYVSRLIDFDWNFFLTSDDGAFLSAFGKALKSQKVFDYILIDARTGYNFPSVVLLQNWATDVVAVGTMSMQSIDGIARMMPIFSDLGIRCHLALSKVPPDLSPGDLKGRVSDDQSETKIKKELVERWYHPKMNIYWLPFLEEFKHGDTDLWSRFGPDVMEEAESPGAHKTVSSANAIEAQLEAARKAHEGSLVQGYAQEIFRLYRGITGEAVPDDRIQQVFKGKRSTGRELERVAAVQPHDTSDLDFHGKIEEFLARVRKFCNPISPDKTSGSPAVAINLPSLSATPSTAQSSAVESKQERAADDLVPSLTDAEMRGLPLAARALARVKVAALLKELSGAADDHVKTRFKQVEEKNGLALLPVAVANLPLNNASGLLVETRGGTELFEPASRPQAPAETIAENSTWTAYSAAVRTPADPGNKARIDRTYSFLPDHMPQVETLRAALALATVVVNACGNAADSSGGALLELGEELLAALDGKGFRIPKSTDTLLQWNAFDAFLPYATVASRLIVKEEQQEELRRQLDQIQTRVIHHLENISLRSDASARRRLSALSFWRDYLRAALTARRAVRHSEENEQNPLAEIGLAAPHSVGTMLSESEAAALTRSLDVPDWPQLPDNGEDGSFREFEIACKLRLHIEIMRVSGDIEGALATLRDLSPRLIQPGHPISSVSKVRNATDQELDWPSLVQDLAGMASALRQNAESAQLYRLALRLYWPKRTGKKSKDPFVNFCTTGLAVVLSRVGPAIAEATIDEFKATGDEQTYRWWPVAGLVSRGQYSDALALLNRAMEDGESGVSVSTNVLEWLHECEVNLCKIDRLAEIRGRWWKLRQMDLNLFSDHQYSWLHFLHAHSRALLAFGETKQALGMIETGLKLVHTRRAPQNEKIQAVLNVQHKLAQLQHAGEDKDQILSRRLALEARGEVDVYFSSLRKDSALSCDSQFLSYLGLARNGSDPYGGIFSGEEAPSPSRQGLAELLTEYAEILFHADETEQLIAVTKEIEDDVLLGFDESHTGFMAENRLAYCYAKAASLALRSTTVFDEAARRELHDRAKRHRDADLAGNPGSSREHYYQRIFHTCRLE